MARGAASGAADELVWAEAGSAVIAAAVRASLRVRCARREKRQSDIRFPERKRAAAAAQRTAEDGNLEAEDFFPILRRALKTGHLIALEGIDGTGKGTQARLLAEALERRGVRVRPFSFPAYGETLAGGLIGTYLNGGLGDPRSIDSRLTAMLYAVDRFELRGRLAEALEAGETVICDRYVGSNMAHQVARASPRNRPAVRRFIESLEFDVLGLPRPELVILLDMPVSLAQSRVLKKDARQYTRRKLDANEADLRHLKCALAEYRFQVRNTPGWRRIPTVSGRRERSREEIHEDVLNAALELLDGRGDQ